MEDGTIIINENFNITFTNSVIEELSEYSKNELLNMNILELIDDDELFKAMQEQENRRKGIPNSYLLIASNKSGKQVAIEVYSQPIMKGDKFMGSVLKVSLAK